jgi:hypothetical protein
MVGGMNVCVNATINTMNADDLLPLVEFVARLPGVKGLMVNFHIPLPGVESLTLSSQERARVCEEAIALKRRGLPILNTVTGLRALARNDWPRPIPYSVVTDCRQTWNCCRANGNPNICDRCGYAVWAELSLWRRFRYYETAGLLRKLHTWKERQCGE